jgi:hypothetical protein
MIEEIEDPEVAADPAKDGKNGNNRREPQNELSGFGEKYAAPGHGGVVCGSGADSTNTPPVFNGEHPHISRCDLLLASTFLSPTCRKFSEMSH